MATPESSQGRRIQAHAPRRCEVRRRRSRREQTRAAIRRAWRHPFRRRARRPRERCMRVLRRVAFASRLVHRSPHPAAHARPERTRQLAGRLPLLQLAQASTRSTGTMERAARPGRVHRLRHDRPTAPRTRTLFALRRPESSSCVASVSIAVAWRSSGRRVPSRFPARRVTRPLARRAAGRAGTRATCTPRGGARLRIATRSRRRRTSKR